MQQRRYSTSQIKTRLLIISDTHGKKPHETETSTDDELSKPQDRFRPKYPTGFRYPLPRADVALHCGDLTSRSTAEEFESAMSMLRAIPAPLKLFIAGNHDVALEPESQANDEDEDDGPWSLRGYSKEQRAEMRSHIFDMIHHAEVDGVKMLLEGTHSFTLENGAQLTIYASPQTPSFGAWAFQYDGYHDFQIPKDVDVVMTHGPPKGILDFANMSDTHAGCEHLLNAVSRSKPRIHCFGHIHEAWGAYHARWNGDDKVEETASRSVATLWDFKVSGEDDEHATAEKMQRVREISRRRGVEVDLTQGENALTKGQETLFVNAAIMSMMYRPVQMPWIVDVNLPSGKK